MKNNEDIPLPSNRKFGFFFTFIFAVCLIIFWDDNIRYVEVILGGLAITTLLLTLIKDDYLLPFNKAWMKFGLFLGMIINPIVLGIIFYGFITPIALAMKLCGRDELRLKNKTQPSYWKDKEITEPYSESFKNQF